MEKQKKKKSKYEQKFKVKGTFEQVLKAAISTPPLRKNKPKKTK